MTNQWTCISDDKWLMRHKSDAIISATKAASLDGIRRAIMRCPRSSYYFHMADQGSRFTRQTQADYIHGYVTPTGAFEPFKKEVAE